MTRRAAPRYTSLDSLHEAGYLNWERHCSKKSTKQTPPTASVAASTPAKRHTKARSATPLKTGEKKVGYFRGAWQELRQVRWPSRAQTWYLTAAVIIFTGFFVALVLLLDALFKYLFNLLIG